MTQPQAVPNANSLPTLEELMESIRGPASDKARATLQGSSIMETDGDTLIIGRGTQVETRITRRPVSTRGRVYNHDSFPLRQPPDTRFDAVHHSLTRRAEEAVLAELQELLDINPQDNEAGHHDYSPAFRLYISSGVRKAAAATAQSIANSQEFGYQRNPGTAGYEALHALLGNSRVNEACRILGNDATLDDLNLFNIHAKAMRDAHRKNPNAALIWLRTQRDHHLRAHNIGAEHILMATEAAFTSKAVKLQFPNPDTLWETFTSLNPKVLRETPPTGEVLETVTTLSHLIHQAAAKPHHTALTAVLSNPGYIARKNHPLATAFLVESARLARTKAPIRKHNLLCKQMDLAYKLTSKALTKPINGWQPTGLKEHLHQHAAHPTRWKDIIHLMPPWAKHPQDTYPNLPKLPTNSDVIERAAKGTPSDDIILLLDEAIQVHATAGKRASVHFKHRSAPYLVLKKTHDGTLHASHGERPANCLTLPTPLGTPSQTITQHWLDPIDLQAARTAVVFTYLNDHWDTINHGNNRKPNLRQSGNIMHRIAAQRSGPIISPLDLRNSYIPLMEAIRTLLHPQTWERAHNLDAPVNTFKYNLSLTLGQELLLLADTNPGAVTWVMAYSQTQDTPSHPGQFITLAKNMLLSAGLEPANWKYAATMDRPTMNRLTQHPNASHNTALLLNAMAQARATPTENTTQEILRAILPHVTTQGRTHLLNTGPQHPLRYNVTRMTMLLCRESARLHKNNGEHQQKQLTQAAMGVLDYILHLLRQDENNIRSSTWNGLLKASNRWHEDIRRQQALNRQQPQPYQSWHSLVGTLTSGPYTVVPLTDNVQLQEESIMMGNCVNGYTRGCLAGPSRIFSVQKGGRRVATGQITIVANKWRETQTRGWKNTDPPDEVVEAMVHTAKQYQTKWEQTS